MARAIWSGSISFGMVSIPVKLYGATESKDISFHLVHATCGNRLKQVLRARGITQKRCAQLIDMSARRHHGVYEASGRRGFSVACSVTELVGVSLILTDTQSSCEF